MFKKTRYDLTFGGKQPDFKLELTPADNINVLIGQNGVGKTMYLVCTWFIHHVMQVYQTSLIIDPKTADKNFAFGVDTSISMTFDNHENMSGIMVYEGQMNATDFKFQLHIENGKLFHYDITYTDLQKFVDGRMQPAIYNSKTARSFSEYERYLSTLDILDVQNLKDIKHLKKLGKLYKLFDIMWFERITKLLKQWNKEGIPEYAQDFIQNFNNYYPGLDESGAPDFGHNANFHIINSLPYIVSDTQNRRFSQLGDGHQSVLMIHVFGRN